MVHADLLQTACGRAVSLDEMLLAREKRYKRQQRMLACYGNPLISVSLVIPGAVKDSPIIRRIFGYAIDAVSLLVKENRWECVHEQKFLAYTGAEWIASVSAPALEIKRKMIFLEQNHPLGRLWDIDVVDHGGQIIPRSELGFRGRDCLLCSEIAQVCARSRRHPLPLLLDEIARRTGSYEQNLYKKIIEPDNDGVRTEAGNPD